MSPRVLWIFLWKVGGIAYLSEISNGYAYTNIEKNRNGKVITVNLIRKDEVQRFAKLRS